MDSDGGARSLFIGFNVVHVHEAIPAAVSRGVPSPAPRHVAGRR